MFIRLQGSIFFNFPIQSLIQDEPHENPKGLHWLLAIVFVLGDMVGGGMIVLPSVLVNSGNFFPSRRLEPGEFRTDPSIGPPADFWTFTAYQLSAMWTLMQKRWPEYQEFCRKPYCEMALRACEPKMRYFPSLMKLFLGKDTAPKSAQNYSKEKRIFIIFFGSWSALLFDYHTLAISPACLLFI